MCTCCSAGGITLLIAVALVCTRQDISETIARWRQHTVQKRASGCSRWVTTYPEPGFRKSISPDVMVARRNIARLPLEKRNRAIQQTEHKHTVHRQSSKHEKVRRGQESNRCGVSRRGESKVQLRASRAGAGQWFHRHRRSSFAYLRKRSKMATIIRLFRDHAAARGRGIDDYPEHSVNRSCSSPPRPIRISKAPLAAFHPIRGKRRGVGSESIQGPERHGLGTIAWREVFHELSLVGAAAPAASFDQ